jgi:thiol-disulfide isomerase/thioredoxin
MTLKLLAVSAALIGMAVTGAVIPGICDEAARATPVVTAAASQQTAPDFTGISTWFNSKPLSIADLRGKVVLVDFWTYGCVNCVNTLRHGITYPVAQDNDSKTWNAYSNQYWPAQYIIDQTGKIVFQHAGEGRYDEIDRTVGRLLNASS